AAGGSYTAASSGTTVVSHLVNNGTLTVLNDTFLTITGSHTHSGSFDIRGDGPIPGRVTFGTATTFATGASFFSATGTLGSVRFSGGTGAGNEHLTGPNLTGGAGVTVSGGSGKTFTFAGTGSLTGVTLSGAGTFANTGTLTTAGTTSGS